MIKLKKRTVLITLLALTVTVIAAAYYCNSTISKSAAGKLYSDEATIPYNKTGLLLGTSKLSTTGYLNPFYRNRIAAAIQLYKAGKIKYLIISGDNGRSDYSEPEDMRADLILGGVDSTHIFLDYAGFRTYDSMVRLEKIFGQKSVTIISQQFHNERALYIASRLGISAIAFNAGDVGTRQGYKTMLREKLARVKVFVDFLIGTKPKFLGPPVIIPD